MKKKDGQRSGYHFGCGDRLNEVRWKSFLKKVRRVNLEGPLDSGKQVPGLSDFLLLW